MNSERYCVKGDLIEANEQLAEKNKKSKTKHNKSPLVDTGGLLFWMRRRCK
jgi:hypothetical protein